MSQSPSAPMEPRWSRIVGIVTAAIDSVLERTAYSLEESRHAPTNGPPRPSTRRPRPSSSSSPHPRSLSHPHPTSQSSSLSSSCTLVPNPQSTETPSVQKANMAPVADVDDTEGFMAAARANQLLHKSYTTEVPAEVEVQEPVDGDETAIDSFNVGNDTNEEVGNVFMTESGNDANEGVDNVFMTESLIPEPTNGYDASFADHNENKSEKDVASTVSTEVAPSPVASEFENNLVQNGHVNAVNAGVIRVPSEDGEIEDRENLMTFKSWGAPTARGKPAAQVRRIIIKGLPLSWCNASKVLSLVHGGVIESINITPSGSAHILFCDHEACKAFYAKYPNGIDLDKEGKVTVFVEMGSEVDVISSQLSFSLSVGATRAVRAVGVSMELSMTELMQVASANNRKVEKVVDTCVPGGARHVVFRFCSIDDAVRFRSMIIREEQWEQCNVQYAMDPCEIATGFHTD